MKQIKGRCQNLTGLQITKNIDYAEEEDSLSNKSLSKSLAELEGLCSCSSTIEFETIGSEDEKDGEFVSSSLQNNEERFIQQKKVEQDHVIYAQTVIDPISLYYLLSSILPFLKKFYELMYFPTKPVISVKLEGFSKRFAALIDIGSCISLAKSHVLPLLYWSRQTISVKSLGAIQTIKQKACNIFVNFNDSVLCVPSSNERIWKLISSQDGIF